MPRPKFSLQSLLLFSLLTASVTTLVLHYPAWRAKVKLEGRFTGCDFNQQGTHFFTVTENNRISLYDLNGRQFFESEEPEYSYIWFSPAGRYAYIRIPGNPGLKVWSIEAQRWLEHSLFAQAKSVEFSPQDRFLFLELPQQMALIDLSPDKFQTPRFYPLNEWSPEATFSADESKLALVSKDRHFIPVQILDLATNEFNIVFPTTAASTVVFTNDLATFLYFNKQKRTVDVVDTKTKKARFSIPVPPPKINPSLENDDREYVRYEFDPYAEGIVVQAHGSDIFQMWDVRTGTLLKDFLPKATPPQEDIERSFVITPTRSYVLFDSMIRDFNLGPTQTLEIWSRPDFKLLNTVQDFSFHHIDPDSSTLRATQGNYVFTSPLEPPLFNIPGYAEVQFIPNSPDMLGNPKITAKWPRYTAGLHILHKYRPEPWWGLAWLPAFWTTLTFAILFLWNIFRRSK
jgi:hypothetical protein